VEKKNMFTTDNIKKAIMNRFQEVNAEKGHILPQAWLTPYLSKLKHKAFFEQAMQQLQAENLIEYQKKDDAHYHIMLTQQGEDYLYPDFKVADAKNKIRNDIFAKFKANQDKTITSWWLNTLYFGGQLNPKEQRIFDDVIESLFTEKLVTTSLLNHFLYLTEKGEKFMSEVIV
jgi:predicted transcriptional regulator